MQRTNCYRITELKDTSKKIRIINFYDNSLMFFGDYKDIPASLLRTTYRIFCPKKDCFEFML